VRGTPILVIVANETPVTFNRVQRVLAYMVASAIGLSILAIIAIVIGYAVGLKNADEGVWPAVFVLPIIGLPIGFILIIVLLVLTFVRRGREAKDASK
jgi:uncharacterized membrane protein YhdT